jgi:hypothetical protein
MGASGDTVSDNGHRRCDDVPSCFECLNQSATILQDLRWIDGEDADPIEPANRAP